ncbi:hypothetical protein DHEL01_v211491 [Diaporthe helianthi]|uniref:Uncharacterized protein n=1 Tax=Diaporthe helianthi TaxID=158607 RepID=A0A2P5HIN9_DIAHE|nr:hypothetical protein DHEL01_v211491 [Diaporthe helianthi]
MIGVDLLAATMLAEIDPRLERPEPRRKFEKGHGCGIEQVRSTWTAQCVMDGIGAKTVRNGSRPSVHYSPVAPTIATPTASCAEARQPKACVDSLVRVRNIAWVSAIRYMDSGYHEGGLERAVQVLAMPECMWCYNAAYEPGTGQVFEDRKPGNLNEFGRELIAKFKSSAPPSAPPPE